MNRLVARTAATLGVAGAAIATTVATAPSAAAATYNNGCGSGYVVVNSASVGTVGTVFLTYNSSSGKNCVVTVRNSSGSGIEICESITNENGASQSMCEQNRTTWGGPVTISAAGQCVTWSGSIGSATGGKTRTNCG
ncbi:spore-associated protein A [Streptomyces sp. NBC_00576]|uniref:spore-associated protein A n=1 Tax=Streptomyces sp. NBC_00576 TaxID=2903665 RepID=UPI002E80175F|nr:spore-associated protein A [Streptomyces sp. NBC_00576]WUB73922.1 spore-associated protein A [Streptomyces sp. NBC_00576]